MHFAIPEYDSFQLGCMVHGGGVEGSNGKHLSAIRRRSGECVCGGGGGDVEIFYCHRGYVERFH